ncbi:unnamed protein product [Ophioblennius macclurei]
MTIGRNSRTASIRSSIRAPKFLDKSGGFYGRLDEPEIAAESDDVRDGGDLSGVPSLTQTDEAYETETFDFDEGMLEDDGETLLHRKPTRRSSRWRRSSRRKQKEAKDESNATPEERPGLTTEVTVMEVEIEQLRSAEEENEKMGRGREPVVVHFTAREDEDDQVLIRDKKRGREEEEEEERKMRREQEEAMKVVKRKNYRKALDRVFRRGWEAFVHNLYSVTLTPMTSSSSHSSSSPSFKKKLDHSTALADFR